MAELRNCLPFLVSLGIVLSTTLAQAQSASGSASATLTDFRIAATDLRPDDGVAAQWSLIAAPADAPWQHFPYARRSVEVGQGDDSRWVAEEDRTFMPAADLARTAPWGGATLFSDGSNVMARTELSQLEVYASSSYNSTGMILVGPHTALTFSGVFGIELACGTGCGFGNSFSHLSFRTYPLGSFEFSDGQPWGPRTPYGTRFSGSGTQSLSVPVNAVFSNDSDSPVQVSSEIFLFASVVSVAEVPEPSMAATLLAGLPLLWRRRRSGTARRAGPSPTR